ncbi:hypothetical protein QM467_14295 [Rhodoblastus sp. 17X3]|uniref:hypothetical protein n=1 Tax=Rhodoblastus sp. 17X3 TaxID=3047026 RepID=UPI0024B6614B|nr:hypothetical protein [Rhodoblastus sp. 17X3]MDI9849225.1 hypothetical protein [Rhodoblastus sp. 17X3]
MGYLYPPPGDAPVIVMKDVGGDVRAYSAQTTAYIQSGRQVRLHECRSACTLALAVPNVCVYPDSVLRFHKAYNPITKATNEDVSNAMLSAYPPAVRQRLGVLTRQYKSLTGSELIRLGVRDCNAPSQPRILMARATPGPVRGENPLSNAFGGLMSGFGSTQIPAYSGYGAPVQVQRVKPQTAGVQVAEAAPSTGGAARSDATAAQNTAPEAAAISAESAVVPAPPVAGAPIPPPRPSDLAPPPIQIARSEPGAPTLLPSDASEASPQPADPPLPPFRPLAPAAPPAKVTRWGVPINGSAPALASARFAPFPYRLTRKT